MQLSKDEHYIYDEKTLKSLRAFLSLLAEMPSREDVLFNEITSTEYIPIDVLEDLFDELVFGQFSTTNFIWQVGSQKLCGSIELKFCHPITGNWITKVGAAAIEKPRKVVQIAEGETKVFDLELGVPALLSFCTISAIRKVGRILGRSLNRDVVNLAMDESKAKSTELAAALKEVDSFGSFKELQDTKVLMIEKYTPILSPEELGQLNKVILDKIMVWVSE